MSTTTSPSTTISPSETRATTDSHETTDSHNDSHNKSTVDSHNVATQTTNNIQNAPDANFLALLADQNKTIKDFGANSMSFASEMTKSVTRMMQGMGQQVFGLLGSMSSRGGFGFGGDGGGFGFGSDGGFGGSGQYGFGDFARQFP
jgi:uncharacterized protein YaaN involved in tellurite resistance